MEWLQKTVWQQGIAALLVLAGVILVYVTATGDVNATLLWVGLGLAWLGLAVPLFSKAFGIGEKEEEEDKEEEGEEES